MKIIIYSFLLLMINIITLVILNSFNQKNKTAESYKYILYSYSGWAFFHIVIRLIKNTTLYVPIFKFQSIFWYLSIISIVNFVYELLREKKNKLFYFLIFLSLMSSLITLFSNKVIQDYELIKHGIVVKYGEHSIAIITIGMILPYLFSLFKVFIKIIKTTDKKNKTILIHYFTQAILTLIAGTFTDLIAPTTKYSYFIPRSAIIALALSSIYIFFMIIRKGFLQLNTQTVLSNIIKKTKYSIILTDNNFNILQVNTKFEKEFELPLEYIYSQKLYNILSIDKKRLINNNIILYSNNYYKASILNTISGDGKIIFLDNITSNTNAINSIQNKKEKINKEYRSSIDKIKESYIKLKSIETYYKKIFDNKFINIIILSKNYKIVEINKGALIFLNLSKKNVLNKNIKDVFSKEIYSEFIKNLDKKIKNFILNIKSNSRNSVVEIHSENIILDNKELILIGFEDITEESDLQKMLLFSEREAALGTLAGGIAHEYNNINTVLFGYAHIMDNKKELSGQIKKIVKSLVDYSNEAITITENLSIFSKNDSELFQKIKISKIIKTIINITSSVFRSKNIVYKTDLDNNIYNMADKGLTAQLFLNLITIINSSVKNNNIIFITTYKKSENTVIKVYSDKKNKNSDQKNIETLINISELIIKKHGGTMVECDSNSLSFIFTYPTIDNGTF